MVTTSELSWRGLEEMVSLIPTLHNLLNEDVDFAKSEKLGGEITELTATWRAKQAEKYLRNLDLEECIEAIEGQMKSIKLQKETFEVPDADEAFLKNELSLFLNVSNILPELGDPKFSGTFVDKHRGVKTFKFLSSEMSQFETCNAAWDMMR